MKTKYGLIVVSLDKGLNKERNGMSGRMLIASSRLGASLKWQ